MPTYMFTDLEGEVITGFSNTDFDSIFEQVQNVLAIKHQVHAEQIQYVEYIETSDYLAINGVKVADIHVRYR